MEMLVGENIGKLPFRGLKKVADLIYFDGPILSHFKDEFNKDLLFYWVDYNNEVNRWIVIQINEHLLSKYLLKKIPLTNIFNNPINDIFFSLEIGDKLEYRNIVQIFKGDLPGEYMPEDNSVFSYSIPS